MKPHRFPALLGESGIYPLLGTAPKLASLKQGRLFGRFRLRCSARSKAKTIKSQSQSQSQSQSSLGYAIWSLAIFGLVSVCKVSAIGSV